MLKDFQASVIDYAGRFEGPIFPSAFAQRRSSQLEDRSHQLPAAEFGTVNGVIGPRTLQAGLESGF